jgi:prepilin signal peptidase PulO-like enzyme (type II secretory pathway)
VRAAASPLLTLLPMAILGLLVGLAATFVAARRTASQPVDQDLQAEYEVLAALCRAPAEIFRLVPALRVEDFTDPDLAEIYHQVKECSLSAYEKYAPQEEPDAVTEEIINVAVAAASADTTTTGDLVAEFLPLLERAEEANRRTLGELTPKTLRGKKSPLLHYGTLVMLHGATRQGQMTSRTPIDTALVRHVRVYTAPTKIRQLKAALAGSAGSLTLTWALSHSVTGTALLTGCATVLITVFAAINVALVDSDTFFLDTPLTVPLIGVAWLGAVLTQVVAGHPRHLLAGAVLAFSIVAGFEAISRGFSALNGRSQGFGDSVIVLLTVGVPGALTGSWKLGLYGLIAGCATAIVEWIYHWKKSGGNRDTPLPFGPHLALGALIATTLLLVLRVL